MSLVYLFRLLLVFTVGGLAFGIYTGLSTNQLTTEQQQLVELRQSTSEKLQLIRSEFEALRNLVAAYVVSNDSKFLNYYYELLELHAGKRDYKSPVTSSYWSSVIAGTVEPIELIEKQGPNVKERLSRAQLDEVKLNLASLVDQSNALQTREQTIFALTQGLYDPASKQFVSEAPVRKDLAIEMLFSREHLELTNLINAQIRSQILDLDMVLLKRLDYYSERIELFSLASLFSFSMVALILMIGLGVLQRFVVKPLKQIEEVNNQVNRGQFDVELPRPRLIKEMITLVNGVQKMLGAFSRELKQRDALREAELKQLEAQLGREKAEAQSEAKGHLLAHLSHEIRTPMNAIIGMTDLALKADLPEKPRRQVRSALTAARLLLGLLNDILDFSKAESGMIELEKVPFQLKDVLSNSLLSVQTQAEQKGINLCCSFLTKSDLQFQNKLIGDPLRLRQIYTNLLSNAVKFTHTGEVKVINSFRPIEDNGTIELHAQVIDTGVGMTPSQCEKVFGRFFQAENSVARQFGGTGLGLSICKQLCELMKGEIWVESTIGKGANFQFKVILGIASTEELIATQIPSGDNINILTDQQASELLTGLNVLVLEDHAVNQELIQSQLCAVGIRPFVVSNGEEALEILNQTNFKFDLIISDLEMPRMDGYEFAEIMQKQPVNKQIPLLGLSGNAFEQTRIRCLALGMRDLVTKPTEAARLYYKIAEVLDLQNQHSSSQTARETFKTCAESPPLNPRVVQIFLKNCEDSPDRLRKLLEQSDEEAFQREIHSLISVLALIQEPILSNQFRQFEIALAESAISAHDVMTIVDREWPALIEKVSSNLQKVRQ